VAQQHQDWCREIQAIATAADALTCYIFRSHDRSKCRQCLRTRSPMATIHPRCSGWPGIW
jgi:hypothetical protein